MLEGVSVNADESGSGEKKLYSFAELMEMNDEDFLKLDKHATDLFYDYQGYVSNHSSEEDRLLFSLIKPSWLGADNNYIPYKTEKEILSLFEGYNLVIESPVWTKKSVDSTTYCPYFDFLEVYIGNTTVDGLIEIKEKSNLANLTKSDIMEFVKFEYCVDQAIDMIYNDPDLDWSTGNSIKYGDVNDDGILNVRDCSYIATCLASKETDKLNDTADFNCDGEKNIRDAAKMAQFILGRDMSQQENFSV
ncbi:MAG: dockerin type I repeat-containing protein [Porcipelethomonas sp.]